jgi:hypothetical protein
MMAIPFTQYLLPDGRRKETGLDRPADIEALAELFIAAGGKYECEVLTTGAVSLTACMVVDGEMQDVEIAISKNDESILDAVDNIVRASVAHL